MNKPKKRMVWYRFDKDDISTWPELHETTIFLECYENPMDFEFIYCEHGIKEDQHILYRMSNREILLRFHMERLTHWMRLPRSQNMSILHETKNIGN